MLRKSRDTKAPAERRKSADPDDVALIGQVARGDIPAFEALYRSYHPRLARFLEQMTRRPQLVDET
jgi:RNA polymerase sigma-70 factor (ECF subfamily)